MVRNLSIIIPFYQKKQALKKTWEELQLQLHPDDRVYVVDDHSPDGVPEFDCLCTKVMRPPKHTPHIYGLNTFRNFGIEHAENDACIIIDPDCIPNPTFLDHARKIYDPSVLFAGWIWYIDKDGGIREEIRQTGSTRLGESMWIDRNNRDCIKVLGGCMYFSKRRAELAGLFDTDFNGTWGWGEHSFASTCYNSGMRLRFETGLTVYHQWHEDHHPGCAADNRRLLFLKMDNNRKSLNYVTPYTPAVVVLMVPTVHPRCLDQRMRAIFRHMFPIKVRLVNNGIQSKQQLEEISWWGDRWAVDYIDYKVPEPLSNIRSGTMRDYCEKGYKYLIMLGDDITPMVGSLTTLVSEMGTHKKYHALSGYLMGSNGDKQFIGGNIENKDIVSYPVTGQTVPTSYINLGFTIIRLNKLGSYLDRWKTSWNDLDWSKEATKQGLQVGITGKAGAYYQQIFTTEGRKPIPK